MKSSNVYIETFGCQMNVADSERAAAGIRSAGFGLTQSIENADVIIFNTCSIRARAEQKVYNRIGEIRKRRGAEQPIIGLMGCVAQLEGEEVFKQAPSVRFVAGTGAVERLPSLIESAQRGLRRVLDVGERVEANEDVLPLTERHSEYVAFVPIIEGCNKFCTYCIVPYSRGRERSRPASDIIREVLHLASEGFSEIHLIGQNVNSYRPKTLDGLEGFAGSTPFSRLLRAVASTGFPRIKFTTSFPRDFHRDIVAAIEENENLCNWVHLPVQSGNDRVLRAMRRGYKIADYIEKIEAIKSARRDISVTSDIIVGFPGETEEEFQDTLRLINRCQYDSLYIFKYSERPGTPASKLPDTVSEEEKTRRFIELERLQMGLQRPRFETYVGSEVKVLAERVSAKSLSDLSGHTTCHKVVNFEGVSDLLGRIVPVRITQAKEHSLYGKLIS